MHTIENRPYFFDEGLRFECQKCHACCTGTPGIVHVTKQEAQRISEVLGKSIEDLRERKLIEYLGAYRLIEDPKNGDCIFLGEQGCEIYDVRPLQCKTWPFWFENLRSHKAWRKTGQSCPGIGQGRLFLRNEILEILFRDQKKT